TCLACERIGVPLYLQITDDFMHSLYQDVPFGGRIQAAADRWTQRTSAYATGRSGISPVMAEEYAARYGQDWSWFATLVEADAYHPTPADHRRPVRIVFAGNLEPERWNTLRRLALALHALRRDRGLDTRLLIYAPPDQAAAYRAAL